MEKIIHQIWVGPNKMPEREKKFVEKLQQTHPSFEYKFWYDHNLPELPPNIKAVYDWFKKNNNWAFCADILRYYIIYLYGGVYLDVDFDSVEGLEPWGLENFDGFLYHGDEGDYTISNQFFAIKKGHPLSKHIINNIDKIAIWYGPSWFGLCIKEYYNLPYTCTVDELRTHLLLDNFKYIFVRDVEKYMLHYGLFSWGDSNKNTFEKRATEHPLYTE
jgi:mannosyltransferase OCH1-like enzyme